MSNNNSSRNTPLTSSSPSQIRSSTNALASSVIIRNSSGEIVNQQQSSDNNTQVEYSPILAHYDRNGDISNSSSPILSRNQQSSSISPPASNSLANSSTNITNNDTGENHGSADQEINEDDLEALLSNYLSSETDVDLLSEKLGKQLSTLETEMVVGILESGLGVNEVVSQLGDKDQTHLTGVTAWIDYYNKQLQDMKKYIEHIESKNNKMNVVSNNQKELMKALEYLLNLLTLDEKTIKALDNPDFNSVDGLAMAIKASGDLKKALTTKLKSGMEHMVAVRDQRKQFETYKLSFSRKVYTLIEREFKSGSVDANKDFQQVAYDELPEHTGYFESLNRYKPLMHWLKQLDFDKFLPLIPLYIKAYRSSYKHEIKHFFSSINQFTVKESKDQNDFFSSHVKKTIETNNKQQQQPITPQTPTKNQKKRTIDVAFRVCLSNLESSIMQEQKFLMEYFLFTDPPTSPNSGHHHHHHRGHSRTSSSTTSTTSSTITTSTSKLPSPPSTTTSTTTTTNPSSNVSLSPSPTNSSTESLSSAAEVNPLDLIMTEMFDCIVPELKDMVEKADQINPFYLLTMLIDTEQYIAAHTTIGDGEYSSFLIKTLSEVQKTMKTLFNKFIDLQVDSIKSTQPSLKSGVLSHFKHFPIFVNSLEKYRSTSVDIESITSLINSSYYKVVVSLNGWLDGLVDKLPADDKYRFITRTENYYYLYTKIEEMKISCLKPYLDSSQQRYRENLNIYINYLIDLKFKPLIDFYQKMDELLLTLPPSDIQFQQSHSKQQFKKIVEKFKTENIEKGLSKALSNIQKHISKESQVLIRIIWDSLEDSFIEKYDHYQDLTQKCYQQAMPVSTSQIMDISKNCMIKSMKEK